MMVTVKRNVNVHAALHTASRNLHTPMIKEFEDQERIRSDSSDFASKLVIYVDLINPCSQQIVI